MPDVSHLNASAPSSSNKYHTLLALVQETGGTGITTDELLETTLFNDRTTLRNTITTLTEHNILDTIEAGVPGEERTLIIPGKRLLTATDAELAFVLDVLFDSPNGRFAP